MLNSEAVRRIRNLVCETFPNDIIPDNVYDLKMGDLKGWDSLGNFNLILAVELEFDIRFSMDQATEVKSVDQIIKILLEADV
jgi:acyl carrier protein